MHPPQADEFNPYYSKYISLVDTADIVGTLETQIDDTVAILSGLSESQADFRYAPGKWSIKEMLQHLTDTERIFSYRALRIARNDKTPIEGYEQDDYVANGAADHCTIAALIDEFVAVRRATVLLFEHLQADACLRVGTANNNPVSVRALAWIIAGHELHHRSVVKEKYLAR